jgi:trimeric autotransporter adhesin
VKFHLNRFLRRVRIHGGEFDTSARAMYREGVTSSLRADLRIVRRSTIERKQMSTKTTFKRIALVTVAAMGFGVMSVVPSTAATSADTLTISSPTASMKDSETSTATTATLAFYADATTDSMTVTAFVTSSPAGSTAVPQLTLAETSNAWVSTAAITAAAGLVGDKLNQVAFVSSNAATKYVTAKFNINMVASSGSEAAGVKAGTYVLTLAPAVTNGGGIKNSGNVTLTITVTADPTTSTVATSATSIITSKTETQVASDATVTAAMAAKTAIGDESAYIKVTLKNASGITTTGESYTAIVKSGPGLLGSGIWAASTPHAYGTRSGGVAASARGRAITVDARDVVAVFGDGSSGVTTIEIQSALGVVLATEKLTFFGTATTATATVEKAVIGTTAQGGDAVLVKLADAAGTAIQTTSVDFYVTSSDTTKISGNYTKQTATYDSTEEGYLIDLNAVAAGTASITIGTKSSATATTGVNAAAVSVRVGGGAAALDDVKVAFDKASYLPGELATISVTPVDKDGLVLADGETYTVFATGGIVAPVQLGTGSATITGTQLTGSGLGLTAGVQTFKVYMPSYQGAFVFKYTTGTMATTAKSAVARTVSVDVVAADGGAAAAAAEEATAAANDATDAALSAAEAAEAATAMAQEAVDAVAELSASVTKLISALRAQITTLTNLVVKIQKKVRA